LNGSQIHPFSFVPIRIKVRAGEQLLGRATGFLVPARLGFMLISNKHVFTGRHPESNEVCDPGGAVPDNIRFHMFSASTPGTMDELGLPLFEEGKARFRTALEPSVDVAGLPIHFGPEIQTYGLDVALAGAPVPAEPSDPVAIVGFPEKATPIGPFPIWKTGHIASDLAFDARHLPCFLVDATTRSGMSGSPVIAIRHGSFFDGRGGLLGVAGNGVTIRFLGVYSGMISEFADMHIGVVWKPSVVEELIARLNADFEAELKKRTGTS
jgi:hypothetical protein